MKEIFERVSIRKFQAKPVEREKLEQILRAAMAAPSARNQQPWEFYVVTDREKIQALAQATPYSGCAAGAAAVLVPCYRKEGLTAPSYAQIDLSIATENILLEITSLGLGVVWLGIAPIEERMRAVEETVGIAPEHRAFALVALGYPAETKRQQDRFEPERIHWVE